MVPAELTRVDRISRCALRNLRRFNGFRHCTDVIPRLLHRKVEIRKRHDRRIKGDGRVFGSQIDACLGHTGELLECFFNSPHARGAGHSFNGKCCLACFFQGDDLDSGSNRCFLREYSDFVTSFFDRRGEIDDLHQAWIEADLRLLCRQIHAGVRDALDLRQCLFYTTNARRAGHAVDGETHLPDVIRIVRRLGYASIVGLHAGPLFPQVE